MIIKRRPRDSTPKQTTGEPPCTIRRGGETKVKTLQESVLRPQKRNHSWSGVRGSGEQAKGSKAAAAAKSHQHPEYEKGGDELG